jgi:hypothetical protein
LVVNNNGGGGGGDSNGKKVKVFAARQRMYAQVYKATALQDKEETTTTATTTTTSKTKSNNKNSNSNNNMKIAVDVSPGYLFYASKVAYSILCTTPWTKMIILLQNPVDRVYKQWVYGRQHLNLRLDLEDWMAQEMKLMQSVGLIGSGNGSTTTTNTNNKKLSLQDEKEAWKRYQAKRSLSGMPIGRSLYVFQLQEWLEAIKEAGLVDKPTQQLYIMPSEVWESNTSQEYPKLIQFLELAEFNPPPPKVVVSNNNNNNNNNNLPPMKNETRQMLQEFFAPYNKRLAKLLTTNGFDSYHWKELWK